VTPPAAAAVPAPGGPAVAPRPRVAPRKPRRVSGPARRPPRTAQRPAQAQTGLLPGALAALNSLSSNRSLDRLIRGRTWIALIAFALIGIVTLQLLVLELNAHIGRALVQEGQLQRENAALSIESSELAAGERVESQAAKLGMELVPEGALRFLTVHPRADIARAAAALSNPVHTSSTSTSTATTAGTGESASASSTEAVAGASSAGATSAASEQSADASTPTSPSTTEPSSEAGSQPGEAGTAAQVRTSAAVTPAASAGASAAGAAEAAPGAAESGTQAGGVG
jgi:cell division protein FtsL